ncbi:MAG: GAF domain-containing protein [Gammaproteobacteria bacterium]|nr:GAF domain-containing protein [Gammaproteobacteria bacterium]
MPSVDGKPVNSEIQVNAWQKNSDARNIIHDWIVKSRLAQPLIVFSLLLLVITIASLQVFYNNSTEIFIPLLMTATIGLLGITALIIYRIYKYLLHPLRDIQRWAHSMHGGEFFAQIDQDEKGHLWDLIDELNRFGKEYSALVYNVDEMVAMQTSNLAQKTRSLEVLYDVAARLNVSRDLNDLLERTLDTLMDIVSARAGSIRLLTPEGKLKLLASKGLEKDIVEKFQLISSEACMIGNQISEGEILSHTKLKNYPVNIAQPLHKGKLLRMIAVPLQHHDKNVGICKLFVESDSSANDKDIQELLTGLGRHLGLAIEKSRLDHETQRLSIMQERAMLANELHDSLAQTFASLRFQVRMLDMTLQQVDNKMALEEIEKIENGLEHANKELRELMSHFRIRMDERGLVPALEEIVSQFEKQTDIKVFLHKDCRDIDLPPDYEVQILRIIQESLANIKKHSQAHTARIMLHCNGKGQYRILIEDDGVGVVEEETSLSSGGHHIGQSVMQERAQRIKATLTIESEPGEGTQVILSFNYPE